MTTPAVWRIDISAIYNKKVKLETKEGFTRVGKITKVVYQPLDLDGQIVQVPMSIEMDGSWNEAIPFEQLVSIKRVYDDR